MKEYRVGLWPIAGFMRGIAVHRLLTILTVLVVPSTAWADVVPTPWYERSSYVSIVVASVALGLILAGVSWKMLRSSEDDEGDSQ